MSAHNARDSQSWLFRTGSWLARDMGFEPSRKRLGIVAQRKLEKKIENWRDNVMQLIQKLIRANTEIDRLTARVAELENEWVSVEDRLPEAGEKVDVWVAEHWTDGDRETDWHIDAYSPEDKTPHWYTGRGSLFQIESFPVEGNAWVTHWRPLPPPPTERGG